MVQDFRVLECFSCRTFQVHEVKKTKKWTCKMCGEKQSVIKVVSRGSGRDCRRHVQQLNSKRGEKLEQCAAWSSWEEERKEAGEGCEDRPQDRSDQNVKRPQMSRWNKYLDRLGARPAQEEEGPAQEEEGPAQEEEGPAQEEKPEENVFVNSNHGDRNVRKRISGWRDGGGSSPSREVDCWRSVKQPALPNLSPSATSGPAWNQARPGCTRPPSQLNTAITCQALPSPAPRASRWSPFLPVACLAEEDLHSGEPGFRENCSVGGLGRAGYQEQSVVNTFNMLKSTVSLCVFEEATNRNVEPTHMPTMTECPEVVCQQPPPTKRPRPSLSAGSLFNSGDDFDDSIN